MIDLLYELLILKSIGVTVLLLVILFLRPWILKWSNANIAYSLWLMLPIYLLLPVDFIEVSSTSGMMTFFLGVESLPVRIEGNELFSGRDFILSVISIWFAGTISLLSLFIVRYLKMKRRLFSLKHDEIGLKLDHKTLGKMKNINLVGSELIDVPAVFGLLRSYLVLPKDFSRLPTKNKKLILSHELYHLSRHDHRFNFLRVLIKSLFWFNPIFYWADKFCEADQEISCDLGVLQNSGSDSRLIYAKVLLESITSNNQNKLLSQWKYQSLIKERVKMLKNISSKKWHSWVATIFAASIIWLTSGFVVAETEGAVKFLEASPTLIVQPRYPRKAALSGIEGWVKFRFNVDANGHPYEVAVIDAQPRKVFELASRRVIYKWRFDTNRGQKNLIYTMQYQLDPKGSD